MRRRAAIEMIATLGPVTIGWLNIPLTPSRAAALAALEARRPDFDPVEAILDFLDDEIFSIDRAPSGAA